MSLRAAWTWFRKLFGTRGVPGTDPAPTPGGDDVSSEPESMREPPPDTGIDSGDFPGGRYHYRRGELVVRVAGGSLEAGHGLRTLAAWLDARHLVPAAIDEDGDGTFRVRFAAGEPLGGIPALAGDMKDDGFQAQPNYVFFADDLLQAAAQAGALQPSPLWGSPLWGSPLWGSPLWGSPLWGSPLWGSPLWGSPGGGPCSPQPPAEGAPRNLACPATAPASVAHVAGPVTPNVVILDSGLADAAPASATQRPPGLAGLTLATAADRDDPDANGDNTLDAVAGHGTFIAGLVQLLAPGSKIDVRKVFGAQGDVDEFDLSTTIGALTGIDAMTIVNLSFSGETPDDPFVLSRRVRQLQQRGAVVVASAGNDATNHPQYPACLPGVVGVGAVGSCGPAWFTNWGPWVRACAPGMDLVSMFFAQWNGSGTGVPDPDDFRGWARWSGTSFAAPIVAAALAREMMFSHLTANDAVARVIDAPGLLRLPGLGTVVNLAP